MDRELIKLVERLIGLTDDELIAIVNHKRSEYKPDVVVLARIVMVRRGFSVGRKGMIIDHRKDSARRSEDQESQTERASSEDQRETTPTSKELNRRLIQIECVRCKGPLEYMGTRRLHEDKSLSVLTELGEMYKQGTSEFLDVYVCSKCGHTELFVEGLGEDLRPE